MGELKLEISEKLEKEMKEVQINWQVVALGAIKSKLLESRTAQPENVQKEELEALAEKSLLTEEDALFLGKLVKESRLKKLGRLGLI